MLQSIFHLFRKAPLIGVFLFAGFFTANLQAACETDHYDEMAVLDRVHDGDTIRLSDGRKVRLIAVNTPEMAYKARPAQAFAVEATQFLRQMLKTSKQVYLKYGADREDRHKRLLAHVFTRQGKNLAAELIRRGLGFAIVVPPNDWQQKCYFEQERHARKNQAGIWSHADYQAKPATALTRDLTGFQRIEGRVNKIGQGKKWLWLDLAPLFSIKVLRRNLKYFENQPIESLAGKRIRVRGWAAYYNGKLRMSLRHPAMMELLD